MNTSPHAPRLPLIALAVLALAVPAHSASFTWDSSGSNPGAPTGGGGTWSSSNANWSDGVTDSGWNNAGNNSAVFLGNLTSGTSVSVGEPLTVESITFNAGGAASYTLSGNAANVVTVTSGTITANRTTTISANIGGANGLTKAGANGTLVLMSANSYTGTTYINAASLQPRVAGALPTSTTVVVGQAGSSVAANLDIRFNQTVAGITKAGTGDSVIKNSQLDGTATLTVNPDGAGASAADSTFAGRIADGDANSFIALTKAGSHTLTLTGINTYSGNTTVSAGTLLVNGSIAATSAVSVGAAGTLGGSGTVGGSVSVLGTLAPGNSIATLNTGALTIGATGKLAIELGISTGTPISDRANVTGSVSLANGADLELTLFSGLDNPANGDTFWLVSNDDVDAVSGTFTSLNGVATNLTEGSTFTWNSQEWQITYTANFEGTSFTGGNDIAIQAVPEPGVISLSILGLLIATARRRKRA